MAHGWYEGWHAGGMKGAREGVTGPRTALLGVQGLEGDGDGAASGIPILSFVHGTEVAAADLGYLDHRARVELPLVEFLARDGLPHSTRTEHRARTSGSWRVRVGWMHPWSLRHFAWPTPSPICTMCPSKLPACAEPSVIPYGAVVRLCEAHALAVAPRGKALLLLLLGKDDLPRDASVLTDGEVSTVGAQTVR